MHDSPEPHSSTTDTSQQEWIENYINDTVEGDIKTLLNGGCVDYGCGAMDIRMFAEPFIVYGGEGTLIEFIARDLKEHHIDGQAAFDEAHTVDFY